MKYLMYITDGSIRKFPLSGTGKIIIGRSTECDLVLNHNFISRKHVELVLTENELGIKDLGSTNGLFIKSKRVKSGSIKVNEIFQLKDLEIALKSGEMDDLIISDELKGLLIKTEKLPAIGISTSEDTEYIEGNILTMTLKKIMNQGLLADDISQFFLDSSSLISKIFKTGSLLILTENLSGPQIIYQNNTGKDLKEFDLNKICKSNNLFAEENIDSKYENGNYFYSSYINGCDLYAFIFFSSKKMKKVYFDFLKNYLQIINLVIGIIPKNKKKKEIITKNNSEDFIVTRDKNLKKIINNVKRLSSSDIFILISGESGTGKELIANLIHMNSSRNKEKFIAINCAAIPENLLEAELFGYEKGAFTGASEKRIGKLELSSEGTLLLDEIGEMDLQLQVKLLRAIQEGAFYRVGGLKQVKVDLRIISSTNKDLQNLIKENKFREDLYYRIVHVNIELPPLRERKDDINSLIEHFSKKFSRKLKKTFKGYSVKATNTLNEYPWPGNIRELENEIYKLVTLVNDNDLIDFDLLSPKIKAYSHEMSTTQKFNGIKEKLGSYEKENIIKALMKNNGNKTKTANELGMSYNTLFRKIKKYNIKA